MKFLILLMLVFVIPNSVEAQTLNFTTLTQRLAGANFLYAAASMADKSAGPSSSNKKYLQTDFARTMKLASCAEFS